MYILSFTTQTSFFGTVDECLSSTWSFVSSLTTKIYNAALHYFKLLEGLGLIGCSVKELLVDYLPLSLRMSKKNVNYRIQGITESHFSNIQSTISTQFLGRGIFYGVSGTLKTCAFFDQLQLLGLGKPLFTFGGLGFFLLGCFFSLERNIKIFQEAEKMEKDAWCVTEQNIAQRIKFSAILGMISDLSYIVSTLLSLFSFGMAIYIILGSFALFSISLKNIYDFFFLQMQESM